MGFVTYFIDYCIPKTVKAQLSPYLPFMEGWRRGDQGREFLCLNNKGKIRGKVLFFIDRLPQTGKMFMHWFDVNQFLTFPAKGMTFKVSCGGCNKY